MAADLTPWLHVRGQFSYHGEALISGTLPGLIALRDAITGAIENRDAEAVVFANDGEGYAVTVRRCARLRDMGSPPYIDELARRMATYELEWVQKTERRYRDLWLEKHNASAIEARSDATGTGAAEGKGAVPKADAQPTVPQP